MFSIFATQTALQGGVPAAPQAARSAVGVATHKRYRWRGPGAWAVRYSVPIKRPYHECEFKTNRQFPIFTSRTLFWLFCVFFGVFICVFFLCIFLFLITQTRKRYPIILINDRKETRCLQAPACDDDGEEDDDDDNSDPDAEGEDDMEEGENMEATDEEGAVPETEARGAFTGV